MHWIAPSEKDSTASILERRFWDTADQIRANSGLKAQGCSGPNLGTIFLRFAEVRFAVRRAKLERASISGDIFLQSKKIVESHDGKLSDTSIYGKLGKATIRLQAAISLAIRGIGELSEYENISMFTLCKLAGNGILPGQIVGQRQRFHKPVIWRLGDARAK